MGELREVAAAISNPKEAIRTMQTPDRLSTERFSFFLLLFFLEGSSPGDCTVSPFSPRQQFRHDNGQQMDGKAQVWLEEARRHRRSCSFWRRTGVLPRGWELRPASGVRERLGALWPWEGRRVSA